MRVRVRDARGITHRVEVPGDATLGQLWAAVRAAAGLPAGPELRLSLNKKTELEGGGDAKLSALDIRGGDLLHVLGAPVDCAADSGAAAGPPATSMHDGAAQHIANSVELPQAEAHLAAEPTGGLKRPLQSNGDAGPMDAAATAANTTDVKNCDWPPHLQRVVARAGERRRPDELLALAVHAALLKAGLVPEWAQQGGEAAYSLPLHWGARTSFAPLRYMLSGATAAGPRASCSLKIATLGPHVIACISLSCGPVHQLTLPIKQYIVPTSTSADADMELQEVRSLWVGLCDRLAAPTVAGMCAAEGRAPPLGLLALPAELKERCLGFLQAPDLAALAQTCTALQHAAYNDALWEALYTREWGPPTPGDMYMFRLAFRERWVQRARVRQLRDRERERMRHQPRPHVPPNRFQPLPHQPGLPIIGGDFDRLPQPLLGSGPGMLGMGGAAILGGRNPFGGGPAMGLGPGPAFPMGHLGGRSGRGSGSMHAHHRDW